MVVNLVCVCIVFCEFVLKTTFVSYALTTVYQFNFPVLVFMFMHTYTVLFDVPLPRSRV